METTRNFSLDDGTIVRDEPPEKRPIWERVRLATGLSGDALSQVVTELRRYYTDEQIRCLPPWEIEDTADAFDP